MPNLDDELENLLKPLPQEAAPALNMQAIDIGGARYYINRAIIPDMQWQHIANPIQAVDIPILPRAQEAFLREDIEENLVFIKKNEHNHYLYETRVAVRGHRKFLFYQDTWYRTDHNGTNHVIPRALNKDYYLPDFPKEVLKKEIKPVAPKKLIPKTVGHYFNFRVDGLLGIEIEVEGEKLPKVMDDKWKCKNDGSLRGEALEYIFAKPVDLEIAKQHILDLKKAFTAKRSKLDFSYRTSVHVHVNITDLVKEELRSFLYLSHLFESALVRYSGENRSGNRFCLRTSDAEFKLIVMKNWLEQDGFCYLGADQVKYSAINFSPITSRGSVEFRSMRGNINPKILFPWIETLANIKEVSRKTTAIEMSRQLEESPEEFCKYVFGKNYKKFYYDEFYSDVQNTANLLIEIPYIKLN